MRATLGLFRTNLHHAPFKKKFWTKRENMALVENELLKIMNVFNYTKLTLIFTSLTHFIKRDFERVNKLDERSY